RSLCRSDWVVEKPMNNEQWAGTTEARPSPRTVLCLASYEKGAELVRECKRQGWHVLLVTRSALEHGDWPSESVDELFHMPDLADRRAVINGVSYLARQRRIERVVPLDDFDVQMAAAVREHMAIPGLGVSTAPQLR